MNRLRPSSQNKQYEFLLTQTHRHTASKRERYSAWVFVCVCLSRDRKFYNFILAWFFHWNFDAREKKQKKGINHGFFPIHILLIPFLSFFFSLTCFLSLEKVKLSSNTHHNVLRNKSKANQSNVLFSLPSFRWRQRGCERNVAIRCF